jgi:uncharacterized membrane protein (DUF106 family)
MQIAGKLITTIFDLILQPFSGMAPVWGLLAVSVLTGVVMIAIFKYTSNQSAIKAAKDKISAYFMEVRLFKDDLGLMLGAQKRILRTNLTYMRYSVTPMLVMIIPVILILVQLGIRYAARPLQLNESAVVQLKLDEAVSLENIRVSIDMDDGLRLETPLIKIPTEHEVGFRVGAVREGEHEISILVGDERLSKTIAVSDRVMPVYDRKSKPSFMGVLLYPGQATIPKDSAVEEIYIKFPPQEVKVLGRNINWLVFFFIISIIAGYSLKGVFKVEV